MSYMPGALNAGDEPARRLTAPAAKTSRERAACFISNTSSMPGEDDLVLADDGAAADGGDAYLLRRRAAGGRCGARRPELGLRRAGTRRRPLLASARCRWGRPPCGGGGASTISTSKSAPSTAAARLHEVQHEVDAEGHVAGLEHRHLLRRGFLDLLRAAPRSSPSCRGRWVSAARTAEVAAGPSRLAGLEKSIDDVGLARVAPWGRSTRESRCGLTAVRLKPATISTSSMLGADADDGLAHVAVAAGDDHLQHVRLPLRLCT